MTEDHDPTTPEQREWRFIGQMDGLYRADQEDNRHRWAESVTEMALTVALSRLGVQEITFTAQECLAAMQDQAGLQKTEEGLGIWKVVLLSNEQARRDQDSKHKAMMAAMFGESVGEA